MVDTFFYNLRIKKNICKVYKINGKLFKPLIFIYLLDIFLCVYYNNYGRIYIMFIDLNARNHFKILPLKGDDRDPKSIYEELLTATNCLFEKYHPRKGFKIEVYELNGTYYLIQSVRTDLTDYGYIYINSIYCMNNENDALAIGNFLHKNLTELGRTYKGMVNEWLKDK